jgi:hypothetical protein
VRATGESLYVEQEHPTIKSSIPKGLHRGAYLSAWNAGTTAARQRYATLSPELKQQYEDEAKKMNEEAGRPATADELTK